MPQCVDLPLGISRLRGELRIQLAAPFIPRRLGKQCAAVEQLIEQDRVPGQVVGGPCACSHQVRESWQHRGMLDQQREIDAAAADGFEQRQQPRKHGLRLPRAGSFAHQLRHQRVVALARCDRQLQVTAALPHSREHGDQPGWIGESRGAQRFVMRVIKGRVEPDRFEFKIAFAACLAEKRVEVALHRGAMIGEHGLERRRVDKATGSGKRLA